MQSYHHEGHGIQSRFRTEAIRGIKKECGTLLPHLATLNGAGLPASVEAMATWKPRLGQTTYKWKSRAEVEKAVSAIEEWLGRPSKLRKTINVLQQGGLFWCAHVDTLCLAAYRHCGPGKASGTMCADAVARLCQGDSTGSASTPINRDH